MGDIILCLFLLYTVTHTLIDTLNSKKVTFPLKLFHPFTFVNRTRRKKAFMVKCIVVI